MGCVGKNVQGQLSAVCRKELCFLSEKLTLEVVVIMMEELWNETPPNKDPSHYEGPSSTRFQLSLSQRLHINPPISVEVIVVHSEKKGNRCNYARIIEYIDNTSARQNVITAPL
jgi:hypothetical protein